MKSCHLEIQGENESQHKVNLKEIFVRCDNRWIEVAEGRVQWYDSILISVRILDFFTTSCREYQYGGDAELRGWNSYCGIK